MRRACVLCVRVCGVLAIARSAAVSGRPTVVPAMHAVAGGESFPRVYWVAVPKASRARRVNRATGLQQQLRAAWQAISSATQVGQESSSLTHLGGGVWWVCKHRFSGRRGRLTFSLRAWTRSCDVMTVVAAVRCMCEQTQQQEVRRSAQSIAALHERNRWEMSGVQGEWLGILGATAAVAAPAPGGPAAAPQLSVAAAPPSQFPQAAAAAAAAAAAGAAPLFPQAASAPQFPPPAPQFPPPVPAAAALQPVVVATAPAVTTAASSAQTLPSDSPAFFKQAPEDAAAWAAPEFEMRKVPEVPPLPSVCT
jgi:hypothetical protein